MRAGDPALDAEVDRTCASFRERYGEGRSSEVPGAADARTLYKALGIDPTKTRPSNEALLRRALKGETLYRINTLVDALNLVSLREQLPFGLYDLDRVKPPVVLRKGGAGEGYEGIRKGLVNVEARPVLVDAEGPFGNPTSDSARTMITSRRPGAGRGLRPGGYSLARLNAVLDTTAETLTRFCGGARADAPGPVEGPLGYSRERDRLGARGSLPSSSSSSSPGLAWPPPPGARTHPSRGCRLSSEKVGTSGRRLPRHRRAALQQVSRGAGPPVPSPACGACASRRCPSAASPGPASPRARRARCGR